MKHYLTLINLFLVALFANAQLYYPTDTVVVVQGVDTLSLGFSGGSNAPQFSEIDLNQDGKKDLFLFDREGNTIKTFLNEGTTGEIKYKFAPEYIDAFPNDMQSFALLKDYNCDGQEDIFTFNIAGFKVYKNTTQLGDEKPRFELEVNFLKRYQSTINVYCSPSDIPALIDLDNDSDLDILSFNTNGISVDYYKNHSFDLYGNCDSLLFTKESSCWGQFNESAVDNGISLNFFCKGVTENTIEEHVAEIKSGIHSGSTLLSFDQDGDGDKELLLGDVSGRNLVGLTNGGTETSALITEVDTVFPKNSVSLSLTQFPAAYYLDVNNDSKKDLIVSPNGKNATENYNNNWLYLDNSSDDTVRFEFQHTGFLQNEMLDFGSGAYPALFDHNADGLMDLVVGDFAYFTNGNYSGKFALLENIGTNLNPNFEFVTDNYQSLGGSSINGKSAFGDLDNDGDEDMIVGLSNGKMYYYENNAGVGNTAAFTQVTSDYFSIDVGDNATPILYDFDNDGKLDMLVGEKSGTLNFFRNTGTPSAPSFNSTPDNDLFGGIDVMIPCCSGYSYPQVVEYDNDVHLFVGSEEGWIYEYTDVIGNLNGNFTLLDSIQTHQNRVSPVFYDFDGDGVSEIIAGEYPGGLQYYELPSGLALLYPENNQQDLGINVLLNWSSEIGVDEYEVQLDTSLNFNSSELQETTLQYISESSSNTDTEFLVDNLLLAQKYYWRVRTKTGATESNWIQYSFTTAEAVETNAVNIDFAENITIYPNPTSGVFTIETAQKEEVTIYNMLGKEVFRKIISGKENINFSNQPNGVYFLKTLGSSKLIIKKK